MDAPPPSPDRIDLATFLATRDAPCPVCGYNLRSLLSDRCPECGRHLVLAVGTTEPRLGAFIAGLVGLAAGFGFSLLLLAYVFVGYLGGRGFWPSRLELTQLVSGAVVGAGALYLWVVVRRRLGRRSGLERWIIALAMWAVGLVFPIWFLITIG